MPRCRTQLSPKTDKSGAQIVNYLLKAVEDMRDKIVVIVAGYSDQARGCCVGVRCCISFPMCAASSLTDSRLAPRTPQMDELFTFNPGLPSRFPHHFVFEDFGASPACGCMAASCTC